MGAQGFVVPEIAYGGLAPLLILIGGALLVLMLDAFVVKSRNWLGGLTLVLLTLAMAVTCKLLGGDVRPPFGGLEFVADDYALVFDLIFYVAAIAAVALSLDWLADLNCGEYFSLILLATSGMVVLAHAASLVTVFIGIELLSVVLYTLTGFLQHRARSVEAALKYFFLGAFASGFLLYGSALLYGTTGSLDLATIGRATLGSPSPLLLIGMALVLVGFCFKISAVPFHMWTPDVYEGAPTPVAAFMSVGTKAAAFAAMVRVFTTALAPLTAHWQPLVAGVAVLTMVIGNLVALRQSNLKRLFAFSSVAHAGYALVGLVAWEQGGKAALVFYLVTYAAMNLGAFGVVAVLERRGEGLFAGDLAGLASRRPATAAALSLFLLSLAGVPPTAGFFGKFNLLSAAVGAGWTRLAVVLVICSAVSAYYYVYPIVIMYMRPAAQASDELGRVAPGSAIVLVVAALAVVILGVAPDAVMLVIETAARLSGI